MKIIMDANLYRSIIEKCSLGYAHHEKIYDENNNVKDYKIIEVNKVFETIIGLSEKELIGKKVTSIFKKIMWERSNWIKIYKDINNYQDQELEYYFDYLDKYYQITTKSSNEDNLLLIIGDITKEAEQRERLDLFSDNTSTQIWSLQDIESYGYVNKSHADFLGFDKKELEFRNINDFLCDREAQVCISDNEIVFNGKKEVVSQEWLLNENNESRLIKIIKTPKLDEEGDVKFAVCSGHDITEEYRLKEEDRVKERILYSYMEFTEELLTNPISYDALANGIKLLGDATQVDRVYYWENHYNEDSKRWYTSQMLEWCMNDVGQQIENPELQNVPYEESIDFIGVLAENKVFSSHIRNMEYGKNNTRQALEDQGILSILAIPVFINEEFSGFIGFDSCRVEKDWSEVEVSLLNSFVLLYEKAVERKLLEKNINQVKQNFNNFFNMVHDLLLVIDLEGKIISINRATLKKLNYSKAEVIGESLLTLYGGANREEAKQYIKNLIHGQFRNTDIPYFTKDGEEIPVETYATKGLWDGEDVIFITSKDISELKKSEEKFSKAFNNTDISISISSFETGKLLEVNNSFLNMMGFGKEEIIGENILDVPLIIDEGQRLKLKKEIEKNKSLYNYEIKMRTKDNKIRTGLCNIVPIKINGEECLLSSILDITERNSIMEELGKAKEESDVANRAKSNFLSNMSHEIRTPMNAVIGYSELLFNTKLTSRQKDYISGIKVSSGMLMSIINDILDWSKIDNNKLDLENSIFNIEEAIDNVVEQMQFKTSDEKVEIKVEKEENIPYPLYGDPFRLQQVLLNLVSNSIKFTLEGEIRIKISILERKSDSILLKYEVSDTGIGIPEEEIKDIFEPFKQVDNKHINQHEGTGLGLAICRQLVGLMGGDIRVESELGRGTSFFFTTDFKIPSVDEVVVQKKKDVADSDISYIFDHLRGLRVLLVDDNEINQDVLKSIIDEVGMLVTVASSGREAIEKVKTEEFDIVLMDIRMPGMDGYEATAEIRKMKSSNDLPIIAVTASASPDERRRCIASNIDDYITKPINREALIRSIANLTKDKIKTDRNLQIQVDKNLNKIKEEKIHKLSLEIEGIDIEEALSHLNNDEELFLKVLKKFKRNYSKVVDEIRQALSLGDRELAIRLAHTVKGVSGELQAKEIYTIAAQLESEMIQGNFKIRELLLQLEDRLDLMFSSKVFLEDKYKNKDEGSGELDYLKMKLLADELAGLLLENDITAGESISKFEEEARGTLIGDKASQMKGYGEQYDFQSALRILKEIELILNKEEKYGGCKDTNR